LKTISTTYLLPQLFIKLLIIGDYNPAEVVDIIKIVGLCNDNMRVAKKMLLGFLTPNAQDYEIIAYAFGFNKVI